MADSPLALSCALAAAFFILLPYFKLTINFLRWAILVTPSAEALLVIVIIHYETVGKPSRLQKFHNYLQFGRTFVSFRFK